MAKFNPKTSTTPLPAGIVTNDTMPPKLQYTKNYKIKNPSEQVDYEVGDHGQLTFYETAGFGWCLATLSISSSRRGTRTTDRTYAVRVSDGASVRVGAGPHVTRTITVYLRKSRLEALKKYIDMYAAGQVAANTIRDRISSRRAEGAEHRANSEHSWRWRV